MEERKRKIRVKEFRFMCVMQCGRCFGISSTCSSDGNVRSWLMTSASVLTPMIDRRTRGRCLKPISQTGPKTCICSRAYDLLVSFDALVVVFILSLFLSASVPRSSSLTMQLSREELHVRKNAVRVCKIIVFSYRWFRKERREICSP